MSSEPWAPEAFEERYRRAPDPWNFGASPYEQGRYEAIIAALPCRHYRSGYEPGCSIGELTWRLAGRCDALRAVDVSATAVATAAERVRGMAGVTVDVAGVDTDRTSGHDLVVFSEIGYYFSIDELDLVLDRVVSALVPGGDLVSCNWLGHSPDHQLHGSAVHDRIGTRTDLIRLTQSTHDGFVVGAWRRP